MIEAKIVTVATSKGGCGKTTTVLNLAAAYAHKGMNVAILDCDKNSPIVRWKNNGGKAEGLTIYEAKGIKALEKNMKAARQVADVVFIDIEGIADDVLAYACSNSDLVIIPTGASELDVEEANRLVALLATIGTEFGHVIPYSLLLTRTPSAIRPRYLQNIVGTFIQNKIPHFYTELSEREAFKLVFAENKTLFQLSEDKKNKAEGYEFLPSSESINKANLNILSLATEVADYFAGE